MTDLEHTVVLTGQAFISLSYLRRTSILQPLVGDYRKIKEILREKNEILESSNQLLFGESFEEDLVKTSKLKDKSKEVLLSLSNKQPFQQGCSKLCSAAVQSWAKFACEQSSAKLCKVGHQAKKCLSEIL